jgi:fumarate hydratase subunit beta
MLEVVSPFEPEVIQRLKAGDQVMISGVIYTARDIAHKRMVRALEKGIMFDINGQTIYYMGASPTKPGEVIGAAGPTTSGRMDSYTPRLLAAGLRAMIGKGERSPAVKKAMIKYQAIYLATIGGAGALIARSIKKAEVIAYEDLKVGPIQRLEVENFPAIVINDIYGGDLYQEGKMKYQITITK